MRVLHLQKLAGIAGSENYLLRIMPALQAAGVTCTFLALEGPDTATINAPFFAQLEASGIEYDRVAVAALPGPKALAAIAQAIQRRRPDIVHSHLIHADVFAALTKLLFSSSMKLVSTKHGYQDRVLERFAQRQSLRPPRHWLTPFWMWPNLYRAAATFAEGQMERSFSVSQGIRQLIIDEGIARPDRIDVVPHGITPQASPIAAERVGTPQLVLVGRLIPLKGHLHALAALKRLVVRYPSIKLTIVGTGPLRQQLESQARALGLTEHVVFLGFRSDIREQLKAADISLVTSRGEGFGLVILEAFEVGTPVIAFDVIAANEIIEHERSGLLVPHGDSEALATAIARLIDDPAERARLADGGRDRVQALFHFEKTVAATIDFYRRVLNEATERRAS